MLLWSGLRKDEDNGERKETRRETRLHSVTYLSRHSFVRKGEAEELGRKGTARGARPEALLRE